MKKLLFIAAVSAFVAILSTAAFAQARVRVKFPAGTHGTTVKGTVQGYAYRDYVIRASSGQTLSLSLLTTGSPGVFTVFQPGGENLDGAAESDEYSGDLSASGDYVIRVGMMRSAARRKGSISHYTLKIRVF